MTASALSGSTTLNSKVMASMKSSTKGDSVFSGRMHAGEAISCMQCYSGMQRRYNQDA